MVKKAVKMHLSEFQADETFGPSIGGGSWADDDTQDVFANLPLPSSQPASRAGGFDDRTAGEWRRGGASSGGFNSGMDFGRDRDFAPREPVPIPDEAPFTARLINIDYSATESEIEQLFEDSKFNLVSVRLPKDQTTGRIRGYAFVEFSDRSSLESALALDGQSFLNRPLRVVVAERRDDDRFDGDWRANKSGPLPPLEGGFRRSSREDGPRRGLREEQPDDRDYDSWSRRGPLPPSDGARRSGRFREDQVDDTRNYDSWERKGPLSTGRREFSGPRRERREPEPTAADLDDNWRSHKNVPSYEKPARRKLNLAPRTISSESQAAAGPRSTSLFGNAKPVDTAKKEFEIAEKQAKINEQRKIKHEEQQKAKENQKAESLRKGFAALSTDDNDEEPAPKTEAKNDQEEKEVPSVADVREELTTSKEELETGDWETVSRKK